MRARFDIDASPTVAHPRAAELSLCECGPLALDIRHTAPARRERPPRHEQRYGRRGFGPRNASGKARS